MKKLKILLAILAITGVISFISWTNIDNKSLSTDVISSTTSDLQA